MDFTKMLHKFTVVPSLNEKLAPLQRIAYAMAERGRQAEAA